MGNSAALHHHFQEFRCSNEEGQICLHWCRGFSISVPLVQSLFRAGIGWLVSLGAVFYHLLCGVIICWTSWTKTVPLLPSAFLLSSIPKGWLSCLILLCLLTWSKLLALPKPIGPRTLALKQLKNPSELQRLGLHYLAFSNGLQGLTWTLTGITKPWRGSLIRHNAMLRLQSCTLLLPLEPSLVIRLLFFHIRGLLAYREGLHLRLVLLHSH